MLNLALSFKRINGVLLSLFPHYTPDIFRKAEICPAKENAAALLGDTRQLYNEVFLPQMQVNFNSGSQSLESIVS